MNKLFQQRVTRARKSLAVLVIVCLNLVSPLASFAQEAVDATGSPTGAPECTGAGCHQGEGQGDGQGMNQGLDQGMPESSTDTTATNSNTGADSDNQVDVTATDSTNNTVDNTVTSTTNADATANTGGNTSNSNTSTGGVSSGDAGIGVTQVINDNTATIGGTAGLQTSAHQGDHNGDYTVQFGAGTANLSNSNGTTNSVRATNDTTGSGSNNDIDVTTRTEEINEVQNDGRIDNILELAAITGQNQTSMNTENGAITTGDANVAATLVNLLNTTVINGDLWVTVADIFGDLNGNINLPDFSTWLASYSPQLLTVEAGNTSTGANSNNQVNVDVSDQETTNIDNDADINTNITANAITGQNEAIANTGGGLISTGDGHVSAGSVSVANTTVEGGNWGLVIVNALNGWLGFLIGDQGQVRALSQNETLNHIDATNNQTGADSDNTINVDVERDRTTDVENDAVINNDITASAITGQNEANYNTGAGVISTGDANIAATTVNIANTTVKDGSLFIAVVNIFGDWFGDLLYGGKSLAASAGSGSSVAIEAENSQTGADSTNGINVNYDRDHETNITNDAEIDTTLQANIDTGNNQANRNTGGTAIVTGDGHLALHSRSVANVTGIAGDRGLSVDINGTNDTTGADSENEIRATINDDRVINVTNDANVSTVVGSGQNPVMVNTGNNTANQNTLGALIDTGSIEASVAIQNLVNQVIVALAGGGVTIDADFANKLTGALSTNENELTANQHTILNIINSGIVANLLNLLLNTGGNTTNENTAKAEIKTGDICFNGKVDNEVNDVAGKAGATSLTVEQDADVTTDANIDATTGNNEMERNTHKGKDDSDNDECEKVAVAPTPSPSPSATPVPQNPGDNPSDGQGGPDDAGDSAVGGGEDEPRVAGVTDEKEPRIAAAKKSLLRRFPVAGGEQASLILQGKKRLPWQLFIVASMGLLGLAWSFDRRHRATNAA